WPQLIERCERVNQGGVDQRGTQTPFAIMTAKVTKQRAEEIAQRMCERSIIVLGDVMLDEFIWGDVSRISPEAPVPVVNIKRESTRLGGAANVLANVAALGAKADVIGVVGDDAAAEKLREALRANGGVQTDNNLIKDDKRPTTI